MARLFKKRLLPLAFTVSYLGSLQSVLTARLDGFITSRRDIPESKQKNFKRRNKDTEVGEEPRTYTALTKGQRKTATPAVMTE